MGKLAWKQQSFKEWGCSTLGMMDSLVIGRSLEYEGINANLRV